MQIRTVSIAVSAPRETVFNFLADIENLPKWATEFCTHVELRQGRWWARTSQGEMTAESATDRGTGVIDLKIGPAPDQLGLFPLRVLPLEAEKSVVSFTFMQPAGLPDELYEKQYQSLLVEMRGLIRRFGGGVLHAAGTPVETMAGLARRRTLLPSPN